MIWAKDHLTTVWRKDGVQEDGKEARRRERSCEAGHTGECALRLRWQQRTGETTGVKIDSGGGAFYPDLKEKGYDMLGKIFSVIKCHDINHF